ncbi:serrate RNA effector molecule isoform X2 [Ziziphus jujuba]|uniref:Serrate RNA effector molecule isoform X2 n=1 Tax=Ziziphus jujuba TaxID=326968 RepID=A0A6P6GB05_ZIZJJ|nr:serrate RNA effector molecule isoform X2 [Ziziphus jujuba]
MVVKANMQFLDDGLVFYLTLQTLDGDHIVFKEAKVCEYIDTDHCYELSIFRNAIYYDKIKEGSPQRYQECRSQDISTQKCAFFNAHKDEEWRNRHAQEIAKEFLFYLSRGIVNLSPSATAFYASKVNFQTSQPNSYEKAGEKRRRLDKDQDEESEFSAALKAHPVSCLPRRIQSDIEQAFALIQKLDSEKGIEDNIICNIDFYGEFHSESMFQVLIVKCLTGERVLYGIELLDTLLTYLWRIHGVNYYGMIESDEPKGFRHVRSDGKNHTETLEAGVVWEKKLDTFWQKRLSGQHPMEAMIGKEKIDAAYVEASDLYVRKIADENEGWKYGCEANDCTELFNSAECVREHLKLEHPELVMELTSKVCQDLYFHNYMNDPDAPGGTL